MNVLRGVDCEPPVEIVEGVTVGEGSDEVEDSALSICRFRDSFGTAIASGRPLQSPSESWAWRIVSRAKIRCVEDHRLTLKEVRWESRIALPKLMPALTTWGRM